ncbi:DotU family type IV/VI secretion system protein [bacterium]|nr:DotU family type IV/VI secretion system protein [bacterium]
MRLVDCYFELFYYTLFINSLNFSQLTYNNVIKHYNDLFSRSLMTARNAGFSQGEWGKGLFAVSAWIDETILCSGWSGRNQWQRYPLQMCFFKTTMAGEEFFSRLFRLGSHEKNTLEVYYFCLALGFKGQYFDPKYAGKLKELKQAIMSKFSVKDKLTFSKVFFPEAYSETYLTRKGKKGPFGLSLITLLLSILPPIVFFVLLYVFKNSLMNMIIQYL